MKWMLLLTLSSAQAQYIDATNKFTDVNAMRRALAICKAETQNVLQAQENNSPGLLTHLGMLANRDQREATAMQGCMARYGYIAAR
jgi:hypothetical protein